MTKTLLHFEFLTRYILKVKVVKSNNLNSNLLQEIDKRWRIFKYKGLTELKC